MGTKETAIPAFAARLYERTWVRYNQMTSSVPMLDTHDATRQSLIMTALDVFRVGIFVTLEMVKQLSLSDLQIALQLFLILAAWGSRVCPSSSAMRGLEHSFI